MEKGKEKLPKVKGNDTRKFANKELKRALKSIKDGKTIKFTLFSEKKTTKGSENENG